MSQTTKRALEASLKNLLLKKPLDKITISDIAEDCGISRMTFTIISRTFTILLNGFAPRMPHAHSTAKRPVILGKRVFSTFLTPFLKTSPLSSMFTVRPTANRSKRIYTKLFIHWSSALSKKKHKVFPLRDTDKDFIANFYKYAFVGLLLAWVKNGMKDDPKQLVDRLSLLIHGSIATAVERFRTDKP